MGRSSFEGTVSAAFIRFILSSWIVSEEISLLRKIHDALEQRKPLWTGSTHFLDPTHLLLRVSLPCSG